MSYTLKLTNGTTLLTLADQQTDGISTSITLIGKNVNAYGAVLNDNFIKLLENFSNSTEPTNPLVGQLWFNTLEQRLYYYNNSLQFKPVGGPIVAPQQPTDMVTGDLWINSNARQLNFYDGANLVTVGPQYDYTKGKSGVLVEIVKDSGNTDRPVSILYSNSATLGVISNSQFTVRADFTASLGLSIVNAGITLLPGIQFYGTATSAASLSGISVNNLIVSTSISQQSLNSSLSIFNNSGLSIGANEDLQLYVANTSNQRIATLAIGSVQDFTLVTQTQSNANIPCLYFSSSTGYLGVFTNTPQVNFDVNGNMQVRGNLTVVGTMTSVSKVSSQFTNTFVELGYSSSTYTDIIAAGGGILLHGTTSKTFLWDFGNTAWTSSENLNLAAGKSYEINGVSVLTSTALGTSITSAPGLTNLTGLNTATIGQVFITTATIGTKVSTPLIIGTGLTTAIDFNGKKLQNLYTPIPTDSPTVAATKGYVDSAVTIAKGGQYALNIDVTGQASGPEDPALDTFVISMLGFLLPPGDPSPYGLLDNSRARVLVTRGQEAGQTVISQPIGLTSFNVYQAGTTSTISVAGYQSNYVASTNIPPVSLSVNRAVKQYIVSGGTWVRYIYTGSSNTVYTDGSW